MGEIKITEKMTVNTVNKLLRKLSRQGYEPYIDGWGCNWFIYY